MSTKNRWLWLGWAAASTLSACSGHRTPESSTARNLQDQGPAMEIATGCAPLPETAPDYTFSPRPHPPRTHARFVAPPPLDSLPRLVQNAGCTPGGRSLEAMNPRRNAPTATAARPTGRPGRGPVAAATSAPKGGPRGETAKAPRTADASEPTARPASAPPKDMALGGGARAPSAPPAAQTPPAEGKASAPMPDSAGASAERWDSEPNAVAQSAPPRGGGEDREKEEQPVVTAPFVPPEPCPAPPPREAPDATDSYTDWGVATYLSNDDTMSLSSAQRILFAIDRFLPLPPQHLRRHELLNYFSFDTEPVRPENEFSVQADLAPKEGEPNVFTLALAVRGRSVDVAARRNLALTVLVDRSGSMREEGRLTYLKRGLRRMLRELKPGDVVNLVTFNTSACVPLHNFVVGRDKPETLEKAIDAIQPQGNTDLQTGLLRAYQLADEAYRPDYNHRVLLITDALANTGDTDPELMGIVSRFYDARQIRLSGIGVGREFNDRLLDRLTERGKGAYVFLGSEAEVDAVFGSRFVSLIETTALDTRFLLHLPPSLRMNVFYGEESSTSREEVQPIHYFAGTSQLFLSDVMARHGKLREGDMIMLGIEYRDPDSREARVEEHAFRLADLPRKSTNVKKAQLVVEFVDGLGWMAARVPTQRSARAEARGWVDDDAAWECARRGRKLQEMSRELGQDSEVRRIQSLWNRYCERFQSPRGSRPPQPTGRDPWPGATTPE